MDIEDNMDRATIRTVRTRDNAGTILSGIIYQLNCKDMDEADKGFVERNVCHPPQSKLLCN